MAEQQISDLRPGDAKRIRELEAQLREARKQMTEKDEFADKLTNQWVIAVLKKSPGRSLRSLLGSAADVGILSTP